MTKSAAGVHAGREAFEASRGRGPKATDAELVRNSVGRGQLMRRAQHGDATARELLERHGAGDLGGDAA